MKAQETVEALLQNGILAGEDVIGNDIAVAIEAAKSNKGLLYVNKDILGLLKTDISGVNWKELERARYMLEHDNDGALYRKFMECVAVQGIRQCTSNFRDVKVSFDYNEPVSKKEVRDFVKYFNVRYRAIEGLLKNRQELSNLASVGRVINKSDRETVSIIGMVVDKSRTANGNIMITLEDPTGRIRAIANSNNSEVFEAAQNLVHDEVIGLTGTSGNKIIFCSSITFPDIPLNKENKKAPEEEYALFLSDIHVGSNNFLADKFDKFLRWLNGEIGSKHSSILPKIKYIFIVGDLVDGVGIYPGQETELVIKDVHEQYAECARLLSRVPDHMKMIICPGNHDSIRLSEPQPAFEKQFSKPLFALPNAILVSNPAMVNIASTNGFSGFDVLMYHGYSFDYYISNVDAIRNSGGYDRADLVMKFLLQRRHLAPSHTSTLYVPDGNADPLFISKVPDILVSGHIHKSSVASYRNVSMICGSCWQSTTSFQERVGHNPEPAQVPLVNLKTRETRILRF